MLVPVTFRFPGRRAPRARRVAVLGPFNGWDPSTHPLTKTAEGEWVITIHLCPGRVVYCFDVDGISWLDPDDDGRIPNGWGSEYSVRMVRQAAGAPQKIPAGAGTPVPQGGASGRLLGYQKEATPEAMILRLSGEVDLVTAPLLFSALETLAQDGHNAVVDLSGLHYIDSIGFKALLDVNRLFLARSQRLTLSGPPAAIRRIIDVSQIDEIIPIFPSVEAAVESLRAAGPPPESSTITPSPRS